MPRLLLCLGFLVFAGPVLAQVKPAATPGIEPVAAKFDRPTNFEQDVQPIIDNKCVACHNVGIAESRLILEDVPGMLKGGKRGPALVAKDPAKSLIYLLAARSHDPVMPPLPNSASATAFTPQELGILKLWIEEGAVSTGMSGSAPLAWQSIPDQLNSIYAVSLSQWGRYVAAGRANQIDLYDLSRGEYVGRLTDPNLAAVKLNDKLLYPRGAADQDFVHALAFHPSGNLLASAGYRSVKLWQRAENVQRRAIPLDPAATAAALSPNGQWLAVAVADNSIRLIQTADGATVKSLTGHTAAVTSLQFSADNTQIFSGAKDKFVRLWNVADGQAAGQLETPAEVLSLVLAADAKRIFTGQQDNGLRGWNVPFDAPKPAEGDKPAEPVKPVVEMKGHGGPVVSLALVPTQPQLASASADGTWRVWDVNNGNQVRSVGHGAPVTAVAVRNDGQFFASAGGNVAKLWNVNGQQIVELKGDLAKQRQVIGLTDDDAVGKSRVALADASFKAAEKNFQERVEQTKKATEAKTKAETDLKAAQEKEKPLVEAVAAAKKELEGKPDDEALKKKVTDAEAAAAKEAEAVKKANEALEASGKALVQAEQGQKLSDERQQEAKKLHEVEVAAAKGAEDRLNAAKAEVPATEKPMVALVFDVNGSYLATAGEDGVVRTWDAKTGKPLDEIRGHQGAVTTLLAGPERALVSLSADKTAIIWDADPQWQYVGVLGPKNEAPLDRAPSPFVDRVLALSFSPDGKLLATGGGDPSRSGELMLWNMENRTFLKTFPEAHSDTVFSVDFSRDGKWLLSGAADKFVKVHDVESAKLVRSFEGHTHHVLGVSFKADGSRIASAGADNAIKIWNVETGEQHRTIQNYSKQVTSIRFMGTSDNIVSGSGDKTVKFHRANDGGNYRGFGGPVDYVYSVSALRDESIVVAGGEDGVLRVWNGTNAQVLFNFDPPKPPQNQQASAQ